MLIEEQRERASHSLSLSLSLSLSPLRILHPCAIADPSGVGGGEEEGLLPIWMGLGLGLELVGEAGRQRFRLCRDVESAAVRNCSGAIAHGLLRCNSLFGSCGASFAGNCWLFFDSHCGLFFDEGLALRDVPARQRFISPAKGRVACPRVNRNEEKRCRARFYTFEEVSCFLIFLT